MSIQAMKWVWDNSSAKGVARLVHLSLANYADEQGRCWPSQERLAKETNASLASVKDGVKWLIENGYLIVEVQGGCRESVYTPTGESRPSKTNRYRLLKPRNTHEVVQNLADGSPESGSHVVQNLDQGSPESGPYPLENHHVEPSGNHILCVDGSADNDTIKKERVPRQRKMIDYPPAFEAVWSVYPRRTDKKLGFGAWNARVKEGVPEEELHEAAVAYAAFCTKERRAKGMIMLPATFFGPNERWVDWVSGVAQKESSGRVEAMDTERTGKVTVIEF